MKAGTVSLDETDSAYTIEGVTSLEISADGIDENLRVEDLSNNQKYIIVIDKDSISVGIDDNGDGTIDRIIASTKKSGQPEGSDKPIVSEKPGQSEKPGGNGNLDKSDNSGQIVDVKKEDGVSDDEKTLVSSDKAPGTGDNVYMIFWGTLALFGICGFTILFIIRRRAQSKNR